MKKWTYISLIIKEMWLFGMGTIFAKLLQRHKWVAKPQEILHMLNQRSLASLQKKCQSQWNLKSVCILLYINFKGFVRNLFAPLKKNGNQSNSWTNKFQILKRAVHFQKPYVPLRMSNEGHKEDVRSPFFLSKCVSCATWKTFFSVLASVGHMERLWVLCPWLSVTVYMW